MITHFTYDFLLLEVTVFTILRSYTQENLLYPVLDQLSSSALVPYRRMFINRHMKCIHKSRHELMGWFNTSFPILTR